MFTSKEVLEKTGLSRATLNNYISWGIVPRPEVLPPEPHDGAAPRIGYFPETVVQRIEEIQRLKREGWSITRISEHFTGEPAAAVAASDAMTPPAAPVMHGHPARRAMPGLSLQEIADPAYMVNDSFDLVWLNDAARLGAWPNLVPLPPDAESHGIFKYILQCGPADADARQAILRFHLGLAKQRGVGFSDLCRDLPQEQLAAMQLLYDEADPVDTGLLAQIRLSAGSAGSAEPVSLQAVRFREGLLFVYVADGAAPENGSESLANPIPGAGRRPMPALTQVAVLVTDLQHSERLWSELPAEEYFELVNQVWLTADPIFRRHRGTHGKHSGEGLICYFFPHPDSNHLWNVLMAAQQLRDAMRPVSKQWQLRKGWTTELYMNTGIAEGQDWLGTIRSGPQAELTVLGDAVDQAMQISDLSRSGAVWVTRDLIGKLRPQERQRLEYGVRRRNDAAQEVHVSSIFSRIEDLADSSAAGNPKPLTLATLAITEILGIAADAGVADTPAQ